VFGLPHNYQSEGIQIDATAEGDTQRRASPLLFHIQALGDDTYAATLVLFRGEFLPAGYTVNISPSAGGPRTFAPTDSEWNAASHFIAFVRDGQFRKALETPASKALP
jgi:hypothetical protein